jgi:16S rRNA (guanine527-N7)-methyltransferase
VTPSDRDLLDDAARRFGVELAPGTHERIDRFLELLELWSRTTRLTGERGESAILRKHVVDSLAPLTVLPRGGPIVDIGSGAGFPGIVLACARPELAVSLVESRRRRASFLRDCARLVPLHHATVLELRAEVAGREPSIAGQARLVVARALRLDAFLGVAQPFLAADGVAVAMQTPRMASKAAALAVPHALRLLRTLDYRLPDGEPRSLLVFAPAVTREQVS